jgi:hypothetical protein
LDARGFTGLRAAAIDVGWTVAFEFRSGSDGPPMLPSVPGHAIFSNRVTRAGRRIVLLLQDFLP